MSQVDPRTWEIHLVGRTRDHKNWESRSFAGKDLEDRIDDKEFIYELVRGLFDEYTKHHYDSFFSDDEE